MRIEKSKNRQRKTRKNAPSDVIISCLVGTLCAGLKTFEQQSFSQPRTLPASLASTSPPIRSGSSFRPSLPQLVPSRASREARCSPPPSFASSTMLVLRLRCSLSEIQLCRKNQHRLNLLLQSKTTLNRLVPVPGTWYVLSSIRHRETRQSPFMLPSCLNAHATPSHENGDRAPSNPPSTRQRPPTPAMVPRSPAVPSFGYTNAHKTK